MAPIANSRQRPATRYFNLFLSLRNNTTVGPQRFNVLPNIAIRVYFKCERFILHLRNIMIFKGVRLRVIWNPDTSLYSLMLLRTEYVQYMAMLSYVHSRYKLMTHTKNPPCMPCMQGVSYLACTWDKKASLCTYWVYTLYLYVPKTLKRSSCPFIAAGAMVRTKRKPFSRRSLSSHMQGDTSVRTRGRICRRHRDAGCRQGQGLA